MGGHYFAYVKSFEDGKWYNFNDQSVQEIPAAEVQAEIQKMFGGGQDARTSSYMLQYRKHDPSSPVLKVEAGMIPQYLKDDIQAETDKMIAE